MTNKIDAYELNGVKFRSKMDEIVSSWKQIEHLIGHHIH